MEFIFAILLVIVLLAQITLFALFFLERWRLNKRINAMPDYIDRVVGDAKIYCENSAKEQMEVFDKKTNERLKRQDEVYTERFARYHDAFLEMKNSVNTKVDGLLLDYTQAQQAADKVNDFASSLASIFDYDPLKAIQKGREKETR